MNTIINTIIKIGELVNGLRIINRLVSDSYMVLRNLCNNSSVSSVCRQRKSLKPVSNRSISEINEYHANRARYGMNWDCSRIIKRGK